MGKQKGVTEKRIAGAPTPTLQRVAMVQEAQIKALQAALNQQTAVIQRLRKEKEALKVALVLVCQTDEIDPITGEINRIIQFNF